MWLADRLAHALAQRAAVQAGDLGEHRIVELPAGGEHADDLLRVVAEPLDPQRQRVGEARRHRAEPVEAGGQELLGEQRVALAAGEQPVEQRAVGRGAEDVGELLCELVAREPGEVDAQRARRARARPAAGAAGGAGAARRAGRSRRTSSGSLPSVAARKRRNARVEASAQCRSSMTSSDRRLAREPVEHREQRLEHPALVAARRARARARRRGRAAAWPARR